MSAPHDDHHHVARHALLGAVGHCDHHRGDLPPRRVRLEALHAGVGDEVDVRVLERRIHAHRLRVGLALDQAREAVHPIAADTSTGGDGIAGGVLVEHHPERQVRRMVPELLEVVMKLLDPRLVLYFGIRIGTAALALRGVFSPFPCT